jgi:hypothetical protein
MPEALTTSQLNRWLIAVLAFIFTFAAGFIVADRTSLGRDLKIHENRITVIEQTYVTKDDLYNSVGDIVRCLNLMQRDLPCTEL